MLIFGNMDELALGERSEGGRYEVHVAPPNITTKRFTQRNGSHAM